MRAVAVIGLAVMTAGCDGREHQAQEIVRHELGNPSRADFRAMQRNRDGTIVCGEVDASDRPGGGWRRFNAFLQLHRAAVAPPGGVSVAGEMGNPALAGAAEQFNHTCDS